MASVAPSEVPECPEHAGPRQNLVFSGEEIVFDYQVGYLYLEADVALYALSLQ